MECLGDYSWECLEVSVGMLKGMPVTILAGMSGRSCGISVGMLVRVATDTCGIPLGISVGTLLGMPWECP